MADRNSYLADKQVQINRWIGQLARLDALCQEAGDDVRIQFAVQLAEFSQNLEELNAMILEFRDLNSYGREKFKIVMEKNWGELKESFEQSLSQYKYLIEQGTGD